MGDGEPDLKVGVQNTPDLCRHLRPRAVWVIERLGQYQTYGYWHLNWGGWSRHMGNGPTSMEAHRIDSPICASAYFRHSWETAPGYFPLSLEYSACTIEHVQKYRL